MVSSPTSWSRPVWRNSRPAEGEGGLVTPQETELRKVLLNPCWSPPAAARETSHSLSAVGSQGQQLDGLFTATSSFAGHRSPRGTFKCKREDRHPGSQRGAHPTRQPKIQDRKHSITQSLKIVCSWWISPSCLLLLLHLKATQYTAAAARGRLRRVEVIFKVIKLSYLFPKYLKNEWTERGRLQGGDGLSVMHTADHHGDGTFWGF